MPQQTLQLSGKQEALIDALSMKHDETHKLINQRVAALQQFMTEVTKFKSKFSKFHVYE